MILRFLCSVVLILFTSPILNSNSKLSQPRDAARRLKSGAKFEQYFSISTRSQRMLERFLELLEWIDLLDFGGERSVSYQGTQFLVNLLDFCAGRVAYPIDEPESMQAKTTVDKVFGRKGWEMPAL